MRNYILIISTASVFLFGPIRLAAQSEFNDANSKILAYWNEKNQGVRDATAEAKIRKDSSQLPEVIQPLIASGILSYLNGATTISTDALTLRIAKALSYPYMSVKNAADADGNVSVIQIPHQTAYVIAYNVSTCAPCSKTWIEIATQKDGHWIFTAHLDNPTSDDAIHLAWVGSGSKPLLALYGVHWGDPHNRLDVRLYALDEGFRQVWSSLDLTQGEIIITENRIALKYWSAPTPWTDSAKDF